MTLEKEQRTAKREFFFREGGMRVVKGEPKEFNKANMPPAKPIKFRDWVVC